MKSGILPALFLAAGVLSGCTTDPSNPPPQTSAQGVYILSEGTFGQGNASLSYLDFQTGQVSHDLFFTVNNRRLGDVGNQIVTRGNRGYIVVNNSHKIEVFDTRTNASIGTIDMGAGRSPRQLAFINDTLGMVTNLFDASVLVVDLRNLALGQRITVGQNPDGIAIAGGKAFVANSGLGLGRSVSVISLATLSVTRTFEVGDNPVEIQVTPSGFVYILCAGFYNNINDPNDDTPAKIYVLQPQTEVIVDSILIGGHAFKMALGTSGVGYVPGTDSVLVVDTRFHLVTGTFLRGAYYGIAINPSGGDVYLSDPRDFLSPGAVFIYTSSGFLRRQFDAGIIPGSFAFK